MFFIPTDWTLEKQFVKIRILRGRGGRGFRLPSQEPYYSSTKLYGKIANPISFGMFSPILTQNSQYKLAKLVILLLFN